MDVCKSCGNISKMIPPPRHWIFKETMVHPSSSNAFAAFEMATITHLKQFEIFATPSTRTGRPLAVVLLNSYATRGEVFASCSAENFASWAVLLFAQDQSETQSRPVRWNRHSAIRASPVFFSENKAIPCIRASRRNAY